MTVLAVILAAFVLLALLRFGVSVEYSAEGFEAVMYIGPVKFRLYPAKVKSEKKTAKKEAKKAIKKAAKKADEEKAEKKPGALQNVLDMLPMILKGLGRFRRRLLVKRLVIHYVSAGADPAKTAMTFGASNVVIGLIMPLLEKSFRIKRRDLRAEADFESSEQRIYVYAAISIAVWEAVYVVFAIIPALLGASGNNKKTRKEVQENGQTADQRTDGNNNAKSKRDG